MVQSERSVEWARERRFLVPAPGPVADRAESWSIITQGYLFSQDQYVARIRRTQVLGGDGDSVGRDFATLTLKGPRLGAYREELRQDDIPVPLAIEFLPKIAHKVIKRRYRVVEDGIAWDLDVFHGDSEGLAIAECESEALRDEHIPDWCGEELTTNPRFNNEELARRPYRPDEALGSDGRAIFIVHGHSDRLSQITNILKEAVGCPLIVLKDEANEGFTVIEKLEKHLDGDCFVFVLLTADDVGRSRKAEELNDRARQNVVFELGFAMGRFGRKHVVALHEPGVEKPSDIDGLVYISLDSNDLPGDIKKELRAAGFEIFVS